MFSYDGPATLVKRGLSSLRGNEMDDDDEISMDVYNTDGISSPGTSPGPVYLKERVMVDFKSYFEYGRRTALLGAMTPEDHTECQCPTCQANEGLMAMYRTSFDRAEPDGRDWFDEQYLLCSPRVFGYVLREKQWVQLQVDCLGDTANDKENTSWSKRLKLANERTKSFIVDLINGHGQSSSGGCDDGLEVRDLVERKGKGLVILLYGM